MNIKNRLKEIVIGEKNALSLNTHKRNLSWKNNKPRRLLWANELTEVFDDKSSKWSSPVNSNSDTSEKKIKGILKKPWSSKQVALGL